MAAKSVENVLISCFIFEVRLFSLNRVWVSGTVLNGFAHEEYLVPCMYALYALDIYKKRFWLSLHKSVFHASLEYDITPFPPQMIR